MNLIATILQGTNLVGVLVGLGVQVATDIKTLLESSGSYTVDIKNFQDGAIQSATDTETAIAAWKAANGLTD